MSFHVEQGVLIPRPETDIRLVFKQKLSGKCLLQLSDI